MGRSSRTLELMLGAVGLVLLLACVNVANLLLVRASERSRELALRAALGAARSRLARQPLSESIVLAFAGGLGGLALGRALMPVISALGAASLPHVGRLTLDWRVLAFSCALASGSAILFGLAPALRGSRAEPMGAMREQASTGGRSLRSTALRARGVAGRAGVDASRLARDCYLRPSSSSGTPSSGSRPTRSSRST